MVSTKWTSDLDRSLLLAYLSAGFDCFGKHPIVSTASKRSHQRRLHVLVDSLPDAVGSTDDVLRALAFVEMSAHSRGVRKLSRTEGALGVVRGVSEIVSSSV